MARRPARQASATASAEDRLIARHFRPLATHPGAFGLMDDCAALTPPPGCDLVLKTDAIVAGVHFFPKDAPGMVAKKALRVNLSDLAAKGAKPAGFLLAIALPKSIGDGWLDAFARGLGEDAHAYGCPLLGGDTDRTPGPLTVAITVFGELPSGSMVTRMGARPEDVIVLTGTIGDAALGLMLRQRKAAATKWKLGTRHRAHLLGRYLLPQPRNALAEAVRLHASAAMDISDGLVGDLTKLCAASGVTAELAAEAVPLSPAAARVIAAEPARIDTVLTGGDDYEIACTVAPDRLASFRQAAAAAGIAVTVAGRVLKGRAAPRVLDRSGRPMRFARQSYSHF
jgi:thiamine-monophosphate kinase